MFTELAPLLKGRTLLITVARESDTAIRVTVIPKRANAAESNALTTPLSFVGTPEELDRELPRGLAEYAETHHQLSTTLAQAKAEMEAAAKAAQEEARRKSEERRRAKAASASPAGPVSAQPAAPAKTAPEPPSANLFGNTPAPPASSSQPGGKLCL